MQAMPRIARVIVDIALDREFDYLIPANLSASVFLGSRVLVPFGNSRTTGYVVALAEKSGIEKLKHIHSIVGEKPFVGQKILELARWIGEYYCAPFEQAVRAVLPGAVRRKESRFKERLFVSLSGAPGAEHRLVAAKRSEDGTPNTTLPHKQASVLETLRAKGDMFLNELLSDAGCTASPVRALEKKGFLQIEATRAYRNPLANRNILPTKPLKLMPEQQFALSEIIKCIEMEINGHRAASGECGVSGVKAPMTRTEHRTPNTEHLTPNTYPISPRVLLLHGVTGSGKTEVYLQAIDYVLRKGKGAIVLVPEISLTPQTIERFVGRIGNRVAVLHSHLSEGERHDEWHKIHNGEADVVIGARSAVFAPVRNLGLIVVDEEHEPSYKQEEAPRYNARDVAVMRGRLEGCAVMLGSATPSLESWFNVRTGKYRLARLPRRADNRKMPAMRVIDMRIETERAGHASVFSKDLIEAVRLRLDRAEQVILFLNRRGFATSLICPKCGYVSKCDQCSISHTYHRTRDELRCHICGGRKRVPQKCPGCRDPAFKFVGIGTQRVEAIAQKFFPMARIQRMDADITARKDAYDRILGDFRAGKIDILIGTQMIAKGLHFPNVTLVGVIYADLSLHLPDFRAGERTFQLLAQVAGRAGRGEVFGEVIVQTYTPFHVAVQAARRNDYEGFCDQEIEFRRELKYPPFAHLICVTLRGASEEKTAFFSGALADRLRPRLPAEAIVAGPAPAPLARAKGYYRYQIMLRHGSAMPMIRPLKELLRDLRLPKGIACSVDVDAISLL